MTTTPNEATYAHGISGHFETAAAVERPGVLALVATLDERVERLSKALATLNERLQPILRDDERIGPDVRPSQSVYSRTASDLNGIAERADAIADALFVLADRVDL